MVKTINVASTEVCIEGTGQQTIVMLHGWPDTQESWRKQIDAFKSDYVCVSFTMPGFASNDHSDYSVDAVVERLKDIVDAVSPNDKVILLTHDWGCVFGYEYAMRYSDRVEQMIGMDVGDAFSKAMKSSLSLTQKLMVFAYQFTLAISFVLGKTLGTPLAKGVAAGLQAKSNRANIHAGMSMPYAMRWFGANGGMNNMLPMEPAFPFFYVYATKKPMMFHSPQWLERILERPENKVQAFECGHWIMMDEREAEGFNLAVLGWLGE